MQAITGMMLICWAWEDMRYQKLQTWRLVVGSAVLLLAGSIGNLLSFAQAIGGLVPGVYLLGIAAFGEKRRAIGAADGMVILVLGLLYGLWTSLAILLYSLLLFCLLAGGMALVKKVSRKDRLPFIPCILGGYLWYYLPELSRVWLEVVG